MKSIRRAIRIDGVCQKLGDCCKATVWRRVADGTLPRPGKLGGLTIWYEDEIDAAIEAAMADRETEAA